MNSRPIRENLLSATDSSGKLLAHRCSECGQVFFPKISEFCLGCLNDTLEDIELSGRGSVHSFATSALPGQNIKAPYTCGYIDLEEGARLFTRLHPDFSESEIATGMKVNIVTGELWATDEESVVGYYFRPA